MSNKNLVMYDTDKSINDRCTISQRGSDVEIKIEGTNETSFRGSNKVIVSGSAFTAAKHFNLKPDAFTPSYNTMLGLDNSVNEPYTEDGIRKGEQVFLFAVGDDGCGQEAHQVFNVDYTKWIAPENLIPFRYQLPTNDLQGFMRDKYFGKKTMDNRIAYYFKGFEAPPVFKQQYVDGTPIDENIYVSIRKDEVESFVELQLKVTKEDCRDFFLATTGINSAKISSLSLLTAWVTEVDGFTYYQDIRPLTKLHFPNESLIDTSKGLDITYHIFY